MTIRIASFNMENLFTRPSAMVNASPESQQAIDDHALANAITAKQTYSDDDKQKLLDLDGRYHFSALNPPEKALVIRNKIESAFPPVQRRQGFRDRNGRADLTGCSTSVGRMSWQAVMNTRRVIDAVKSDIFVLWKSRIAPRCSVSTKSASRNDRASFPHVMAIDCNDAQAMMWFVGRYRLRASVRTDDEFHASEFFKETLGICASAVRQAVDDLPEPEVKARRR
jgi:hypothetical protein